MADQRSTGSARAWSGVTSIWLQPGPSIGLAVAFKTWCPSSLDFTTRAQGSTYTSKGSTLPRRLDVRCFKCSGVFAEFERSMIVERVKAGLKRARAEGKVLRSSSRVQLR